MAGFKRRSKGFNKRTHAELHKRRKTYKGLTYLQIWDNMHSKRYGPNIFKTRQHGNGVCNIEG